MLHEAPTMPRECQSSTGFPRMTYCKHQMCRDSFLVEAAACSHLARLSARYAGAATAGRAFLPRRRRTSLDTIESPRWLPYRVIGCGFAGQALRAAVLRDAGRGGEGERRREKKGRRGDVRPRSVSTERVQPLREFARWAPIWWTSS